ncbi:MAG: hypothetical protein VXW32_15090 [Myxococcota bacterium]|nr:hypothetical protein [Myxococcota bacterium]
MTTNTQRSPVFAARISQAGLVNYTRLFFVLNLIGGLGVLGSYAVGLQAHWGQNELLWGGIPESVRGAYTSCMFPAALGYLVCFAYLMKADWEDLRFRNGPAGRSLLRLHLLFLATATAWMPLTWLALDHQVTALYWPIQGVLLVTGLSALGIWRSLFRLVDPPNPRFLLAAKVGFFFLVFQCLVLDALVWPRFFGVG